jgi:hypothetical protein
MMTKEEIWKLLRSEFKEIRRSQLLTQRIVHSIKEAAAHESDETRRISKESC